MILEPDALGLQRRRVGPVMEALDRAVIHEIHFDQPHAPIASQDSVGLAQILLRAGVGGVERKDRVRRTPPHEPNLDGFALRIVHQPILVVLVDPGAGRHFKRRGPDAEGQPLLANLVSHVAHAVGELRGVGGRIFTARVLVSLINEEKLVPQILQVLGLPDADWSAWALP